MKTILLLPLLLLCLAPTLQAQDNLMLRDTVLDEAYYEQQGERFRINQFGLSYTLMRDRALTPLRYEGGGITWIRTRYKFKPRALVRRHFLVSSIALVHEQTDQAIAQTTLEFLPARHAPIRLANERIKLYAGGFLGGLANIKAHPGNVNNVLSYELALLLGPSGVVQAPIRIFGQDLVLSNELQFPILALLANTPYAWPLPTAFEEEGKVGDALTVGSWNKYFRVTNQVSLDVLYPVRRRGHIVKKVPYRVAYRWEFVSVAGPNLYQSGTHTLSIARIIAL